MTLRQKFEAARDRAASLAAQSERTDAEETELSDQLSRAESLKSDLDEVTARDARLDALAEVSRAVAIPGTTLEVNHLRKPEPMTAGEYLVAAAELLNGQSTTEEFLDRAAMYHDRAVAESVTADVAGVLPEPIVGPLIDFYDSTRPVFSSFTSRPMPRGGKVFERPKIVQHVAVGIQATEGAELVSQKFTLDSDSVAKKTLGGTLNVSRQMQDWTDPAALGLIITDFAKVYARYTETLAIAHLAGLATDTSTYDASSTASTVGSYVNGALGVFENLDNDDSALTLWIDTASAAQLATPTGATDRTTWAVVREALEAIDANVSVVVSRRLPADTRIMGAAGLVESYEQLHGLLSVVKPTNLTTDVSYSGYNAFFGTAAGFVSVEAAGAV